MKAEANGEDTSGDNDGAADETGGYATESYGGADEVGDAAEYAGQGIDFSSENEGHLVHEHVAEDAARRAGDGAHDDGCPEGIGRGGGERFFDTGDCEHGEAYGVEGEPGVVLVYEVFAEENYPHESQGGADEVEGVLHPKDGHAEHEVTHGAAADGGNEAHDIGAEEVETLGGGEAYAGNGEGECADEVEDLYEGDLHGRGVVSSRHWSAGCR